MQKVETTEYDNRKARVHEKKIFEDLSKFSLLGPKRCHPLYLNKSESPSPRHVFSQVWLKLA